MIILGLERSFTSLSFSDALIWYSSSSLLILSCILYFVGYFYNLTHSISYRLRIYISHPQQTCTKIAIKKSNEGGARAYWQVGFEIIDVFLFRLPSHLSLGWSCFLSNVCPRISSCFGLIIWHKAVRFDIFSNRR